MINIHNLRDSRPDDRIDLEVISLELMEQAQYMGFAFPFPGPKSSSSIRFWEPIFLDLQIYFSLV
jgi:hypothetical protein